MVGESGRLLREIGAGSLAAGFTASLFSPLELVKTRLQVQDDPAFHPKLYRGLVPALRQIAREDGLLRLWSHGFAGFVSRDLLYSGIRIGAYPTVRAAYASGEQPTLPQKIGAGATTGAFGAALANPLDVMRVRMSVDSGMCKGGTGLRPHARSASGL